MSQKDILIEQLNALHDNHWFVSLHNALKGLTEEQASWKSTEKTNSIWEIVNHLIYYNDRYLERFKGNAVSKVKGGNETTFLKREELDWPSTIERMEAIMSEWRSALQECNPEKLNSSAYPDQTLWNIMKGYLNMLKTAAI